MMEPHLRRAVILVGSVIGIVLFANLIFEIFVAWFMFTGMAWGLAAAFAGIIVFFMFFLGIATVLWHFASGRHKP